jgi:hypothetical protein
LHRRPIPQKGDIAAARLIADKFGTVAKKNLTVQADTRLVFGGIGFGFLALKGWGSGS